MIRLVTTIIATLLVTSAFAQDAYLCVGDATAGMSYNSDTQIWTPESFHNGNKYIFRRVKSEDKDNLMPGEWAWVLFSVGGSNELSDCKYDFNEPYSSKVFETCDGIYHFEFNRQTLRFQIYARGNYVSKNDENAKKALFPFIEIGKCSSF